MMNQIVQNKKQNKKAGRLFSRKNLVLSALVYVVLFLGCSGFAYAQGQFDQPISKPLLLILGLFAMALVPIALMMTTSFVKIAVVLALIRNAMGTQQIPPNQIITGLAMILTIYIMVPVGIETYRVTQSVVQTESNQGIVSQATFALMKDAFEKGKEPWRDFLIKNTNKVNQARFLKLAKRLRKPEDRESVQKNDFTVLVPAFIVSELSEAFQIGFVIFLPFLVIDMVVANILLSLGMFQLSPITVSLPFKLLLFVLVDGWLLVTEGLIKGYV